MYGVNMYAEVRRKCLVEGMSIRQASRIYGIDKRTVKKMLDNAIYKGYSRTSEVRRPRLEGFEQFIDEIIETDKSIPRKQRHTTQRIYDRLKTEKNYQGCYNTIRNYLLQKHHINKEMFIPLIHEAGAAQVDFGEAIAILSGQEVKVHLFIMDLPYSDACYAKAYMKESTEAFCDGHVSGFGFFGGVPKRILYDNTRIAVSKVLIGERKRTATFSQLQSYYLFEDIFARVGKGNDKGKVENLVGYVRRNYMVPIPEFDSIEALNEHLENCCRKRQVMQLKRKTSSIAAKLAEDKQAFLALPASPFLACNVQVGRVNSESLVRYQNNDYSVPVAYGYYDVLVKGYVDKVSICYKDKEIASHRRHYGREEVFYNPLHYLPLIKRKIRSFDQAAPLKNWELPGCFSLLRTRLESKHGKQGKRDYIQILQYLQDFDTNVVCKAIEYGLQHSLLDPVSIKHLILRQIDKRPTPLNSINCAKILRVECPKPDLSLYDDLMKGGSYVRE